MFCTATLAVMSFLGFAEPVPEASLAAYTGKYPFERINCFSFFENAQVSKAIIDKAGADVLDFIDGLDAATPIVEQDEVLLALACENGKCAESNAAVAMTPQGQLVAICLYDRNGGHGAKPDETRWIGEKLKPTVPLDKQLGGCPHEAEQFLDAYAKARL
jgi:hypothetical protein